MAAITMNDRPQPTGLAPNATASAAAAAVSGVSSAVVPSAAAVLEPGQVTVTDYYNHASNSGSGSSTSGISNNNNHNNRHPHSMDYDRDYRRSSNNNSYQRTSDERWYQESSSSSSRTSGSSGMLSQRRHESRYYDDRRPRDASLTRGRSRSPRSYHNGSSSSSSRYHSRDTDYRYHSDNHNHGGHYYYSGGSSSSYHSRPPPPPSYSGSAESSAHHRRLSQHSGRELSRSRSRHRRESRPPSTTMSRVRGVSRSPSKSAGTTGVGSVAATTSGVVSGSQGLSEPGEIMDTGSPPMLRSGGIAGDGYDRTSRVMRDGRESSGAASSSASASGVVGYNDCGYGTSDHRYRRGSGGYDARDYGDRNYDSRYNNDYDRRHSNPSSYHHHSHHARDYPRRSTKSPPRRSDVYSARSSEASNSRKPALSPMLTEVPLATGLVPSSSSNPAAEQPPPSSSSVALTDGVNEKQQLEPVVPVTDFLFAATSNIHAANPATSATVPSSSKLENVAPVTVASLLDPSVVNSERNRGIPGAVSSEPRGSRGSGNVNGNVSGRAQSVASNGSDMSMGSSQSGSDDERVEKPPLPMDRPLRDERPSRYDSGGHRYSNHHFDHRDRHPPQPAAHHHSGQGQNSHNHHHQYSYDPASPRSSIRSARPLQSSSSMTAPHSATSTVNGISSGIPAPRLPPPTQPRNIFQKYNAELDERLQTSLDVTTGLNDYSALIEIWGAQYLNPHKKKLRDPRFPPGQQPCDAWEWIHPSQYRWLNEGDQHYYPEITRSSVLKSQYSRTIRIDSHPRPGSGPKVMISVVGADSSSSSASGSKGNLSQDLSAYLARSKNRSTPKKKSSSGSSSSSHRRPRSAALAAGNESIPKGAMVSGMPMTIEYKLKQMGRMREWLYESLNRRKVITDEAAMRKIAKSVCERVFADYERECEDAMVDYKDWYYRSKEKIRSYLHKCAEVHRNRK